MVLDTPFLYWLWTPNLQRVRQHPDFEQLMRDFGFRDYWRQSRWPEHCRPIGDADFECS